MSDHKNLKTAIVTGAGGDIGRAICIELANDGYAVLALDIAKEPNDETMRLVQEAGGTGEALVCDILDADDRLKMADVGRKLGAISLLVNNVGMVTDESLHKASVENFEKDLKINQVGAFACFKAVEKDLIANKGVLTNIASVNGLGVYGHPGYSAAKASSFISPVWWRLNMANMAFAPMRLPPVLCGPKPGTNGPKRILKCLRTQNAGIPCSVLQTQSTSQKW